jgi:hypothetical protein
MDSEENCIMLAAAVLRHWDRLPSGAWKVYIYVCNCNRGQPFPACYAVAQPHNRADKGSQPKTAATFRSPLPSQYRTTLSPLRRIGTFDRASSRSSFESILLQRPFVEFDAGVRPLASSCAAERCVRLDEQYTGVFAEHLKKIFPVCPAGEQGVIAKHARLRQSGWIDRSSAAR